MARAKPEKPDHARSLAGSGKGEGDSRSFREGPSSFTCPLFILGDYGDLNSPRGAGGRLRSREGYDIAELYESAARPAQRRFGESLDSYLIREGEEKCSQRCDTVPSTRM